MNFENYKVRAEKTFGEYKYQSLEHKYDKNKPLLLLVNGIVVQRGKILSVVDDRHLCKNFDPSNIQYNTMCPFLYEDEVSGICCFLKEASNLECPFNMNAYE